MKKPASHKIKLLVIENNPIIGDGRRASDIVNMTDKVRPAVYELMDDIEYSSHGLVKCEIAAWETKDDFAEHNCEFTLKNGTKSNKLDAETFTELFRDGWYGWWNKKWFSDEVLPPENGHSFSYDYDAMIKQHNVISRRNNGEFNMIMLVNIDPVYCYEAAMIGRNAYWINGEPMEYDCPMTAVMNVSVSRRDANFECFGHMMEMIMGHVFCDSSDESGYRDGEYNGMDPEKMNLWNRFVLCDRNFDGVTGCGNVHFSPNSTCDYDWCNETMVMSSWRDWCDNYPNFTGEAEPTNCRAYLPVGFDRRDACRLHHRWWFYAMPHVYGLTEDGYSHSWWDYFAELDYVQSITPVLSASDKSESSDTAVLSGNSGTLELKSGDAAVCRFTLNYRSGKTREVTSFDEAVAVKVSGNLAYCKDCGAVRACGNGEGCVEIWRDGCHAEVNIVIR